MPQPAKDYPILTVRTRHDLRDWLAANHATHGSVWLATFKKHHPDHMPLIPLIEELLCWGWIDSVPRALDADRSLVLIARRNPKSAWSAVNKAHVARARSAGRMTAAGEALIKAAQANGMWSFLDEVDRLEVPPDLSAALDQTATTAFWDNLPRSVKRGTLEWLKTAKSTETRQKRLDDITSAAASGLRPSIFRR